MDKNHFIDEYLKGKHPIEGDFWEMPTAGELERDEALYDALLAERKSSKQSKRPIALRWLAVGIAASVLLLLFFRFGQEPVEKQPIVQQPVVAETIEQSTPQPTVSEPIIEEKKEEPQKVIKANKPHKIHKSHRSFQPSKPQEVPPADPMLAEAEPVPQPEEEVPVIPPDKQALADIFLAEEALQVAYELRAQQEAIRAYAASLTGEELPKPIIAL